MVQGLETGTVDRQLKLAQAMLTRLAFSEPVNWRLGHPN